MPSFGVVMKDSKIDPCTQNSCGNGCGKRHSVAVEVTIMESGLRLCLMPFWLKGTTFDWATGGFMNLEVATSEAVRAESPDLPLELILGVVIIWVVGLLTGLVGCACFRVCCQRPSPPIGPVAFPIQAWERLVTKGVNFLRRRRRIAIAFGNYRNHPLRTVSQTNKASSSTSNLSHTPLRRRTRTPGPKAKAAVLHEGPAINGPHRDRA